MLSTIQIIAIVILGLGVLTALAFTVAFIVVSCSKPKEEKNSENAFDQQKEEINEIDLDQMLAKLEEASRNAEKEKKVEEEKVEEVKVEEKVEEKPVQDNSKVIINIFNPSNEKVEEVKDELDEEEVEVSPVIINNVEPEEEKVEEIKVEEVEEKQEPVAEVEEKTEKTAPEFDYRIRLEKIKESQAKIDRDLDKTSRAILKYERTIRRMERNQKMLDRRALELTNLNLLMYSVTDIKNVDAEKKARQEELTAHIAELKASIQDAQDYVEANREKYESNLKLKDYLVKEQTRYADEVKELEALIASGKFFDDDADGTKE